MFFPKCDLALELFLLLLVCLAELGLGLCEGLSLAMGFGLGGCEFGESTSEIFDLKEAKIKCVTAIVMRVLMGGTLVA